MKDLKNKIVLITGAASGIGRAAALEFASRGSHLVIADIDENGLEDTAREISAKQRESFAIKTDVSKKGDVEKLIKKAIERFGRIDVLVNNAGVGMNSEIRDMDISDWEWIIGINLWGAIHTVHYLLPHMIKQGCGHIVNVSSAVGLASYVPIQAAYTTTKFALVGFSEVLRTELERLGIGVTVICPGGIKTPFFKTAKVKGFKKEVMDFIPDSIFGTAEEVAREIVKGVIRNRPVVIVTGVAKLMVILQRISPSIIRYISKMNMKMFLEYKTEVAEQEKIFR
ncbi:MAG: SDR family oxidoreductase [Spirochaetes bacterium]|nr:SDR family oxidoreductase [Spirochaetota bacterium]